MPLDDRLKNFDGTDFGLYELFYNFGRYLMLSASREGTTASTLQGIWNEDKIPMWCCGFTLDINTEMCYWPVFSANLDSCFKPFIDLMQKMRESGRETAREYYNASGFVCHSNTDIFGHTNPNGKNHPFSAFIWAFWNMSSGWMSAQLYDAYQYTLDKTLLKETLYPIMKESVEFCLDILYRDENGKYMICPSISPENCFLIDGELYSIDKTTTMSNAIIQDLFTKLIEACTILNIDAGFKQKLENVVENLYSAKILDDGRLAEWTDNYVEFDKEHRHLSHLYGLYPADLISPETTPELAKAYEKSLEAKGVKGTGWSLAWKICLWARLRNSKKAKENIDRLLRFVDPSTPLGYGDDGGCYPNLFCSHPPFQIDGNFCIVAGINELLVQSKVGYINILPALPDEWKNGSISGIKAKGNVLLDFTWENGKVISLSLSSPVSQNLNVAVNGKTVEVNLISNEKRDVIV
ncbi:MAG: glycoside hydrolase family 95-like protein [Monoglobales bacterium]